MSTGGPGHDHDFQDSGWCSRCMLRDDGRLLGKGGEVLRAGRGYTPDERSSTTDRKQASDDHTS